MNEKAFTHRLASADTAIFKEVTGRIYRHLEALAYEGGSDEDPDIMLHQMVSQLNGSHRDLDRGGLAGVVDDAFAKLLAAVEEGDETPATELALGIREIRNIVTGRHAFDGPRNVIRVVGPETEDFPYQKISASHRARDFQRSHRISVREATRPDQLRSARAVIFEAPLMTDEIMMAGEARSLGLEMVLIGREALLPGVPTFADAEDAFADLRRRVMAQGAEHGVQEPAEVENVAVPAGRQEGADAAAWRLRAEILEQAYTALMRSMTFSADRHAAKSAELDKMIREDGVPEDLRKAYFEIVANGSRTGDNPVYAQTVNAMRHKIERLEGMVEKLRNDPSEDPSP